MMWLAAMVERSAIACLLPRCTRAQEAADKLDIEVYSDAEDVTL
jgi:hypothetical protein